VNSILHVMLLAAFVCDRCQIRRRVVVILISVKL